MFNGLEALTKTFAKLKIDVDPSTALEVATKQYVDHYSTWRRPNLSWSSVTTVAVESGLDGTSGDIPILFPDGTVRTETSTTRTSFVITRNAVLTTSGAQSGLTGATSEANNTWYALYAVKVTDSSTLWVTVGSTVLPTQANYSALNTAYQTSGWVYLGMVRNGDNSGAVADILTFMQSGDMVVFSNTCAGNGSAGNGVSLATTAGATSLTYTYASGTGAAQIPSTVGIVQYGFAINAGSTDSVVANSANTWVWTQAIGTRRYDGRVLVNANSGVLLSNGSSVAMDVFLSGYVDGILGVGSNPLL